MGSMENRATTTAVMRTDPRAFEPKKGKFCQAHRGRPPIAEACLCFFEAAPGKAPDCIQKQTQKRAITGVCIWPYNMVR